MSGWRTVNMVMSIDHLLYTDQTREEIEGSIHAFVAEDFIDRFCDCNGEHKFDIDENPDRWTKSRYFPCCRVQVGGWRWQIKEGRELVGAWEDDE